MVSISLQLRLPCVEVMETPTQATANFFKQQPALEWHTATVVMIPSVLVVRCVLLIHTRGVKWAADHFKNSRISFS